MKATEGDEYMKEFISKKLKISKLGRIEKIEIENIQIREEGIMRRA
eukprot:CAMPEP_0174272778 /NCGR_PEP_ID=MMETSP0439-20130205/52457_1 /TAXON_ID=0 /ORGANISM="Stereomyxa ramosa, Strain Chinc5" /LENGTH=45 /DNA_ID= /DNA_START= /DNA_END= /DNA_ORIENTATION=